MSVSLSKIFTFFVYTCRLNLMQVKLHSHRLQVLSVIMWNLACYYMFFTGRQKAGRFSTSRALMT